METEKSGYAATWQEELKAEEMKAARKAGRTKERNKHHRTGYLSAMAAVCSFFVRKERPDIAKELLKEFYLNREEFTKYGFKDFDLQTLDKHHIFIDPKTPPK